MNDKHSLRDYFSFWNTVAINQGSLMIQVSAISICYELKGLGRPEERPRKVLEELIFAVDSEEWENI